MDKALESYTNEIEQASWDMLADHYDRGAVILVSQELKIEEVANAMEKDFVPIMKIWLDDKKVFRIEQKHAEDFSLFGKEKFCQFLIVQPYVLIQLI